MSLHTRNRRKRLESQGVVFNPKVTPKYSKPNKVHHYKESDLWFTKAQQEEMMRQPIRDYDKEFEDWKKKYQYPNFVPKDWTDCYKLPLRLDDYCSYVWTKEGETALSTLNIDYNNYEESRKKWEEVIKVINGEVKHKFTEEWTVGGDGCTILYGGKYAFLVRGWGHLTGSGHALNLPGEMARKMQNQFILYILNQLNGNGKYAKEE